MGTYLQWKVKVAKIGLPKVAWLCGSSYILKDAVLTDYKEQISADGYVFLDTKTQGEDVVWHQLSLERLDIVDVNLVVVRHAELLENFSSLSKIGSKNTVVFISEAEDFPRKPRLYEQKIGAVQSHIKEIQSKGYIIKCDEDLASVSTWLDSKSYLTKSVISKLKLDIDLKSIRDVLTKLEVLSIDNISISTVDLLIAAKSTSDFNYALLSKNKKVALDLAAGIPVSLRKDILYSLSIQLGICYAINMSMRGNPSTAEISERSGIPEFLVSKYKPIAKFYDKNTFAKLKNVLGILEPYTFSFCEGVLEALICLW